MIEAWTSIFLKEYERILTFRKKKKAYKVVFGSTTSLCTNIDKNSSCSDNTKRTKSRGAFTTHQIPATGAKSRRRSSFSCSEYDFDKAIERRKRQMNYSRELKASRNNHKSLQINSITRIVVQSFKKLINCERCALFLMDHATNELYFDPLEGERDSFVKQFRFPATTGVAGWVATHRVLVNIRNAYHDFRFNSDIDKQTNFRTRTILCSPVLTVDGTLLGVIQMVNKKKGDSTTIISIAKKKKTDHKHHGYESCFEEFSKQDEETIVKCCKEVSEALQPIISPNVKIEEEHCTKTIENRKGNRRMSSSSQRERRRSSLGSLFSFVTTETTPVKSNAQPTRNLTVAEAMQRHQFRSSTGPQISLGGQLDECPNHQLAISRRKRMTEYSNNRSSLI